MTPEERADAHVPITPEVIRYVQRYQGTCRDCADEAGYCPRNGIACGDSEKAIRFVLEAINYGVSHGYLALASQAAQPAEADGWVMVPREPTAEMLSCMLQGEPSPWNEGTRGEFYGTRENMASNYAAMLAATPKAPATDAGEVERALREIADPSATMTGRLWAEKVLRAALATPPAPNDDLRAAAELVARAVGVSVMPDGTAWALVFPRSEPQPLLADIFSARAALKENRRG